MRNRSMALAVRGDSILLVQLHCEGRTFYSLPVICGCLGGVLGVVAEDNGRVGRGQRSRARRHSVCRGARTVRRG